MMRHVRWAWLPVLLPLAVAVHAEDGVPPWPVEETATAGYVAAYGEVLNHYESVAAAGTAAKEIRSKIAFYNQTIGRVAGVIDVAGKVYAGDNTEAAISGGLTALGELAGTEAGKAMLGSVGLTTAPVTAAIFALQVGWASKKAVDESAVALQIETLYGLVESDPSLKDRSRELGTGDPIPVTPESVDYVWRKVYMNSQWQAAFKAYVVTELQKEWPEQSYWDQLSLPAGNVADDAALLDRKDEYKGYIAGLLGHLNNLAKSREQFFIARRYLDQLKQAFGQLSNDKLFEQYTNALSLRPKVTEFITKSTAELAAGQTSDKLLAMATLAKNYSQSVALLLPPEGKLGADRQKMLADLRRIYDTAWSQRLKMARESQREVMARVEAMPTGVSAPSRYEGLAGAQDYIAAADQEFRASKTLEPFDNRSSAPYESVFRARSPAAQALAQKESLAVTAHYKRQWEQFAAGKPSESDRKAFGAAVEALSSADMQRIVSGDIAAREHVTSLYLQHYKEADLVVAESQKLGNQAADVKQRADKIRASVTGWCLDGPAGLSMQGYVGMTSYRFPKIDPRDEPYTVLSRYYSYLQSIANALEPYGVVSICGGKSSLPGNSALSALPAVAASLADANEVSGVVEQLGVSVEALRERVTDTKWGYKRREEYVLKEMEALEATVREARLGVQGADGARSQIAAFLPKLQTQLANIDNDREYLTRLQRIVARIDDVVREASDLYGQVVYLDTSNNTRLTRPGVGRECSALVGGRALMSAGDLDAMWRAFDRRLADERLTWLSEHFNLGLVAYLRGEVARRMGKFVPASDYIYLGTESYCRYFEPATLESLATAINAAPGDMQLPAAIAKADPTGALTIIFGLTRNDKGYYEFPPQQAPVAAVSRSLTQSYWNAPAKDALRKLVEAVDAAAARFADYEGKEKDFAALQAGILPFYGAFTGTHYDAKTLYNRNIDDPAVIDLYRKAFAAGNAALSAYRSGATNPRISPVRQAQLSRQADDIAKELHFVEQMIRNLETQKKGREEGDKATKRAEKVVAFYAQFKAAYERKDPSRLMALLASEWKAADGTRPSDVETYFRNMFTVFDEIRFDIGAIEVNSEENGRIRVTYPLTIRGFIYSVDTEHEESSTITEVVSSPDQGAVRILETLQGRFWYK